jgi:dTDP-4-dehydrorhamnose reductase
MFHVEPNKRVMIVGGAGLLGQKLIEVFRRETSYRISSVIRSGIADAQGAVYFDTNSRAAWKEITLNDRWRPDFIINAADDSTRHLTGSSRESLWRTRVTLVELLADVCRRIDAHLVQVSCDAVFDGHHGPYHEEHKPQPGTYFGRAKLAAENICIRTGIKHLVLRTMWLYGEAEGRVPHFVEMVERALNYGVPLIASEHATGSPTRTDDVAYGIVKAVESALEGVIHVAGPQLVSEAEYARAIAAAATRSRVPSLQIVEPDPPADGLRSGLISIRSRTALDIRPLSMDTGLESYYIQRDRRTWRVH